MTEIIEILNQIKNTSGRNDKEQILQDNKDNEQLKQVLEFLFNPYVVTGISTKKINKKVTYTDANREIYDIYDLMNYLKNNNSGRDSDIEQIQVYIDHVRHDEKEFVKELATKSVTIGVTAKTLNKIFGKGFIPEFNVMLAESYFDNEHKVNGHFIITEKLDGSRAILIKENGSIKMFSRQGQPLLGFVEIEKNAENLPDNTVLDGEFILRDDNGLNSADLFRATMKVVRKDGDKKNVIFHAFDMLPLKDFKEGVCDIPCITRKSNLAKVLNIKYPPFIQEVKPLYIGDDKEQINVLLEKVIAEGKEGLMINLYDSPYKCKRCSDILKVKKMHTVDLKIVGFEEGEGKYKGKLGRMNVEYKGNIVGVGSGFTDEDRTTLWDNQEEFIGRIAEIQFFEESTNQNNDSVSLRFPVFKCIRELGKEISYN